MHYVFIYTQTQPQRIDYICKYSPPAALKKKANGMNGINPHHYSRRSVGVFACVRERGWQQQQMVCLERVWMMVGDDDRGLLLLPLLGWAVAAAAAFSLRWLFLVARAPHSLIHFFILFYSIPRRAPARRWRLFVVCVCIVYVCGLGVWEVFGGLEFCLRRETYKY
jgi:hypothetical protein